MQACRPADESRKSRNANSDRLKPSSTRRALASLGVQPCRFAMRFRRLPLSRDKRMLRTVERVVFKDIHLGCNYCKYCTRSRRKSTQPTDGIDTESHVDFSQKCKSGCQGRFEGDLWSDLRRLP